MSGARDEETAGTGIAADRDERSGGVGPHGSLTGAASGDPGDPGPELAAIWAEARDRVIGSEGTMPWHVPEDMALFKRETTGFPVVMGRATWESFPERFRPLPHRTNIVLSRGAPEEGEERGGAWWFRSLDAALELAARSPGGTERIWIIGGASLYEKALDAVGLPAVRGGRLTRVLLTRLDATVPGDRRAPALDDEEWSARPVGSGVDERARLAGDDGTLTPHPVPYRFLDVRRGR